jgi:hypothetical protein
LRGFPFKVQGLWVQDFLNIKSHIDFPCVKAKPLSQHLSVKAHGGAGWSHVQSGDGFRLTFSKGSLNHSNRQPISNSTACGHHLLRSYANSNVQLDISLEKT